MAAIGVGICKYADYKTVLGLKRAQSDLESNIAHNIPPGSDKTQVLNFLDANHISHTDLYVLSDDNAKVYKAHALIDARTPYLKIWLCRFLPLPGWAEQSTYLRFKFDKNGKFVSYTEWSSIK